MNGTSLSRAEERSIRALHRRRHRAETGLFLAEGVRIAEEAIDAGVVLRLAVVSSSLEDSERGRALRAGLEEVATVRTVGDVAMRRLAATDTPQGVLLVAETPATSLGDIPVPDKATILVLDAVQDPGNFGTLVRTADAFGVPAAIALPGTVDPWNPKAVRAAAGSSFRIAVVQLETPTATTWLHERDFTILAADAAGTPIEDLSLPARVALVVGNEGAGVRAETLQVADGIVAVSMPGRAESLNVAVAAGILLDRITARAS